MVSFQDPRIGFLWKYIAGEENIRTNLTWVVRDEYGQCRVIAFLFEIYLLYTEGATS